MFNYRNKEADIFVIKNGMKGKIRLFFFILNHPWDVLRLINEFREENGKLQAEVVSLKEALAEEKDKLLKMRDRA